MSPPEAPDSFSAVWAVAYLSLTPLFATVYSSLPHKSFYDSNAQQEKGLYGDAERLRTALTHAVRDHLRRTKWPIGTDVVELDRRTIEVQTIEHTPEGHLLIGVRGDYRSVGPPRAVGDFVVWVEPLMLEVGTTSVLGRPVNVDVPVGLALPGGSAREKPRPSPIAPPVSLLFPRPYLPIEAGSTSGVLNLSQPSYSLLAQFYGATDGDRSYASGLWLRMLYLSAVTVTTLGFGDITPVAQGGPSMGCLGGRSRGRLCRRVPQHSRHPCAETLTMLTEVKSEESPNFLRGPHGWLNWYAERRGYSRRELSHPDSIVIRQIWEESPVWSREVKPAWTNGA